MSCCAIVRRPCALPMLSGLNLCFVEGAGDAVFAPASVRLSEDFPHDVGWSQ